jgi:NTP pyrophosphatase (non-canonical NTP hydrolase)
MPYVTQQEIHALAVSKGWWEQELPADRVPEALMLIVSEAAEAMEDWRDLDLVNPQWLRHDDGKPNGFASELADIVIRCRDLAEAVGIDLEGVIAMKHAYNATRPQRHNRNR